MKVAFWALAMVVCFMTVICVFNVFAIEKPIRQGQAIEVSKAPKEVAQLYLVNGNLMTEAQVDDRIATIQAQKDKYLEMQALQVNAQLNQWQEVKDEIKKLNEAKPAE